jgi:hypothetical protein
MPIPWKLAPTAIKVNSINSTQTNFENFYGDIIRDQVFYWENIKLFLGKDMDYACSMRDDLISYFTSQYTPQNKRRRFMETKKTKWNIYSFVQNKEALFKEHATKLKEGKIAVRPKVGEAPKPLAVKQNVTLPNGTIIETSTVTVREKTIELVFDQLVFSYKERLAPALEQFEMFRTPFIKSITGKYFDGIREIFQCLLTKDGKTKEFSDVGTNFFEYMDTYTKDPTKIIFPIRLMCDWTDTLKGLDALLASTTNGVDQVGKYMYFGIYFGNMMKALSQKDAPPQPLLPKPKTSKRRHFK